MDAQIEARVDAYIDEVWEQLVADITELVSHASVADAAKAEPGAPYGADVRAALDCALAIAGRLGYTTGDDEGHVGWADLAGAEDMHIATIAHVDVVPAGPGWATDPFTVCRRAGWLLGRGVIDDKGPAVLSLYAGAFFKHEGITPRYSFRALLGCDEEVGMTDVKHYLAGHEAPAFLFTPDASFPLCNAEKGHFGAHFVSGPIEGGVIRYWHGAEVSNAIPGSSEIVLAVDADELPAPKANADRLVFERVAPSETRIVATGIGGHASLPEGTVNAVGLIVAYLRENESLLTEPERTYLELLSILHADTAGEAAGVASESPAFGPLTMNAGTIEVCEDGSLDQSIDIRWPDSTSLEELEETFRGLAAGFGVQFVLGGVAEPFSVDASHPAVQALLQVYSEVTGEEARPFAMGGGTYARNFPCAVSFGPENDDLVLPDWAGTMHGPNEAASEVELRRALKIYILALLRLMELEL